MNQSKENSLKNFLILPSVLVLLCFLFVFFYGVYLSFTDLKLGKPTVNFSGFKNYIYLWKNPLFWKSTKLWDRTFRKAGTDGGRKFTKIRLVNFC